MSPRSNRVSPAVTQVKCMVSTGSLHKVFKLKAVECAEINQKRTGRKLICGTFTRTEMAETTLKEEMSQQLF